MMPLRRSRCTVKSFQDGQGRGHRASLRAFRATVVLLVGVVMVGCSSGGGSSAPPPAASAATPSPAASGSLELNSPKGPAGAEGTYTGVLRSDAIEGGCAYLQTAGGDKYEVIPPDGWELQKAPAAVVAPDGRVVARAGDVITVHGHEADMMSICQVGPIIQATDIVAGG
jgi:hypothetical protein